MKLSKWRKTYWIRGVVVDQDGGKGLQGLKVEAWDKDRRSDDDHLGTTTTLQRGRFSLHFDRKRFTGGGDRNPDVYFNVYAGEELVLSTENDVKWNVKRRFTRVRLEVEGATEPEPRRSYRVHPSIGIARIGDSTTASYLGQEVPKLDYEPSDSRYRDDSGAIKRMGCRFRVFEYEDDVPVREVTGSDVGIQWTVDMVNAKATKIDGQDSQEFLIDPGPTSIEGTEQAATVSGTIQGQAVKLGDLQTDAQGRLIVYGGHGTSRTWNESPIQGLYNAGWYDDVADGPIHALITLPGGEQVEAEPAWVITSVPDFAHPIQSIVSLHDLAEDVSDPDAPGENVSFTRDIYPVLRRTVYMRFASRGARYGHRAGTPGDFLAPDNFARLHTIDAEGAAEARSEVFARVRNPDSGGGNADGQNMPTLAGLAVTPTQYSRLERWKNGDFEDDWPAGDNPQIPASPAALDQLPVAQQPAALDRASLDFCVGGTFQPGIEAGDIMTRPTTYAAPYRVDVTAVEPGELTMQLSVPWQADYYACGTGWWPGGRPTQVTSATRPQAYQWVEGVAGMPGMVNEWAKLGFLARDRDAEFNFIDTERLMSGPE